MPAYKVKIPKRQCQTCPSHATHEVFNTFNASVGFFCNRCADRRLSEMKKK